MIDGLLPTHPIFLPSPQAFPYEVFGQLADGGIKGDWSGVDSLDELQFVGGVPGREAV